jgi:hypothetical protein
MASKPFQEKQIEKEKELAAVEKFQKEPLKDIQDKNDKVETDHKHQKDTKETKDNKDQKEHKDKQEKEKHEKEKQEKEHKNEKQEKHEKEHFKEKDFQKEGHKELEQQQMLMQPQMAAMDQAASFHKLVEYKQIQEKPQFKFEKHEKNEWKEIKIEWKESHEVFKGLFESGPINVGQGGDPYSQRIANLEAVVTQLLHFIPENLRPDLSQGALKQEADVKNPGAQDKAAAGAESAPKEDKSKR